MGRVQKVRNPASSNCHFLRSVPAASKADGYGSCFELIDLDLTSGRDQIPLPDVQKKNFRVERAERAYDIIGARNRGCPVHQVEGSGLLQQLLNCVRRDRVLC